MKQLFAMILILALAPLAALAATVQIPPGGLSATIKTAKPGDVLVMPAGSYGSLTLFGPAYDKAAPGITIDLSAGAELKGLTIQNAGGITFVGGTFRYSGTGKQVIFLKSVHDVNFKGSAVTHLPDTATGDDIRRSNVIGAMLDHSKNVRFSEFECSFIAYCIAHDTSPGLTVADSKFHDIRCDALRGNSSDVTVIRNDFRRFFKGIQADKQAEHCDVAQWWTVDLTSPIARVVLRDNYMVRDGGDAVNGFQFGDESDRNQGSNWLVLRSGYEGVEMTGNLWGIEGHCANVEGAKDLLIANNLCATADAQIIVSHSQGGRLTGNRVPIPIKVYLPLSPPTVNDTVPDKTLYAPLGDYARGWWDGRSVNVRASQ